MLLHRVKFIFLFEVSTFTLLFCFETFASACFMVSQAVSTTFFKTSTARISGNSFLCWHKLLSLHSLIIRRYRQAEWSSVHFLENLIFSQQGKLTSVCGDARCAAQVTAASSALAMGKTAFFQVHRIACTLSYVLCQKFGLCHLPHISQWCFVGKGGCLLEEGS